METTQEKLSKFLRKAADKAAEAVENIDTDKMKESAKAKGMDLLEKSRNLTSQDLRDARENAINKVKNFDPKDFNLDVPATIEKVLAISANVVDREKFLNAAIGEYVSEETAQKAVELGTDKAGIRRKLIDTIADQIITSEVNKASGLSVGAGSTWATLPADIIQYFGFVVRIVQKLAYLYGYPEFILYNDEETLDEDATEELAYLIAVMFGVEEQDEKAVGEKMGKLTLAKGAVAPVPILGGVLSGGLTYGTLRQNANRLKNNLSEQFDDEVVSE